MNPPNMNFKYESTTDCGNISMSTSLTIEQKMFDNPYILQYSGGKFKFVAVYYFHKIQESS